MPDDSQYRVRIRDEERAAFYAMLGTWTAIALIGTAAIYMLL